MTLHGAACRFRASLLTALVVFGLGGAALAQRRGFGGFPGRPIATEVQPNISPTATSPSFAEYTTAPGGYWYQGLPSWAHGYPVSEHNLMRIMNELSFLHAHDEGVNVLTLDDPRLFQYPMAYIIEVSWWTMTSQQGTNLRAYMMKGGFVIVDDFKAEGDFGSPGWAPFEANMQRVLPGARFVEMKPSHPVFHSFFEDRKPRPFSTGVQRRPAELSRALPGQRPHEAAPDDRQLQHGHLAVLGVVGTRHSANRRHQRSVQARRQLHRLRPVPLALNL